MKHQNVQPISKDDALRAFASNDETSIRNALVALAFHEDDWEWVQDKCLEFLEEGGPIADLAASCLGQIAKSHGKIDHAKVHAAFAQHAGNEALSESIMDALEDIRTFAPYEEETIRCISVFDKITEEHVEDFILERCELAFLQKLVNEAEDNDLYDCWDLDEAQVESLRPYFTGTIDFTKNTYMLEAYTQPVENH